MIRAIEGRKRDFEAAEGVLRWCGGFGWLRFWPENLPRNARGGWRWGWAERGTESATCFIKYFLPLLHGVARIAEFLAGGRNGICELPGEMEEKSFGIADCATTRRNL